MSATCFSSIVLKPERAEKLVCRSLGLLDEGEDLGLGITIEYSHELGKIPVFIERLNTRRNAGHCGVSLHELTCN